MITAGVESFAAGLEELKALLPGHYDELSQHSKRDIPLDPQYGLYLAREANGELMYVALREDGRLIGYFLGFLAPGMHYRTCLTLTMDILYVVPEMRGVKGGMVLGQAIRNEAQRRGVKAWFMGFKEEHREHMERMLLGLGFKPFERTYVCWLD